MDETFTDWLNGEMATRSWSYNELGRRIDLSGSTVSLVMTGKQKPSWEFCAGLGKALNIPPEDILRRAGLLSPVNEQQEVRYILETARALDPEKVKILREFAEFLYKKK